MTRDLHPWLEWPSCGDCHTIGIYVAPWLAELERDCGPAALRAFLNLHGGERICLTHRPRVASGSPELQPVYDWLAASFGAGNLDVPLGPAAHKTRVAWTIHIMNGDGASAREIVARTGCNIRTVHRHRHRLHQRAALTASTRKPAR